MISKPNERSSHKENTPNLGGVAIAVGLLLVILIFGVGMFYLDDYKLLTSMCVSILILLVVGIRDDVVGVSPKIKLLIEIVTVTIFTLITDVKIESFYGIFGVYELPNILSYLFTVFVFVVIINSYNLIDGIDGLAGTIAVVILFFLLCSFVESSYYFGILFCSATIGSLLAFLRFNLFSKIYKVFMGDVGSLFIGFVLASMAVLSLSVETQHENSLTQNPVFIMALFVVPFIDVLRVVFLRLMSRVSLFTADKNHLHHKLIDYGFSHIMATFILVVYNLFIVAVAYILDDFSLHLQLLITVLTAIFLLVIMFKFFNRKM
ncbi:MAG: MraY family glycosyltransferase [Flavobacteriales bacterium]